MKRLDSKLREIKTEAFKAFLGGLKEFNDKEAERIKAYNLKGGNDGIHTRTEHA